MKQKTYAVNHVAETSALFQRLISLRKKAALKETMIRTRKDSESRKSYDLLAIRYTYLRKDFDLGKAAA